jgi:hypothetical protein
MSGPWHPTGRAQVNPSAPKAHAICNRCGFRYLRSELVPQYEWAGLKQQNLELYVCMRTCYDTPQVQLKTIILPADPMPVYRPFPELFSSDDAGGGSIPPPFPAFKAEDVTDIANKENWEANDTDPLPDLEKITRR